MLALEWVSTQRVPNMVRMKNLRHGLLVSLEDTRYALKSVGEGVAGLGTACYVCDHKARCALVQYQLPRVDHLGQLTQERLDDASVGDEIVDDLGPCFVQALVPYAGRKELYSIAKPKLNTGLTDVVCTLLKERSAQTCLDQVHLVD